MGRRPKTPTGRDEDLGFSLDDLDPVDEAGDDLMADMKYTGDAEVDSAAELETMRSAFSNRAKREYHRRNRATDSEYWFTVSFQSREQVEDFLRQTGWGTIQDKYLNGLQLAQRLGIKLKAEPDLMSRLIIDSRIAALAAKE